MRILSLFIRLRFIYVVVFICLIGSLNGFSQSAWPSENWSAAENLTPIMNSGGLTDLSGLFWNGNTKRLYVSNGNGGLRVLQLNTTTNVFTQIKSITYSGGPEGITQANLNANEFFTIDEDNYQIRKYTHPSDFSSLTLSKSWNITAAPSPMTNTGNTGPEGIAFVPDSFLNAAGFISQATGNIYTSTKGLGGLIFVAHQSQGYVWVFDINPNVSNDFAYVGKYKTNKSESCDLSFDRSTGLLYILHNTLGNTIEVTDLKTSLLTGGERKFIIKSEYTISNPAGSNINVEGFTIASKCTDSTNVSAFLCRDVENAEALSYRQDCIRWFRPFNAPGSCSSPLPLPVTLNLKIFIEGFYLGGGTMMHASPGATSICDSVIVELHQATGQHALAYTKKQAINIDGTGLFEFPSSVFGNSYYIVVRHRNTVETWSAAPVSFNSALVNYSFTTAASKAFGNNLKNLGGGNFALFSGDVDQDGSVDSDDIMSVKNVAHGFMHGYLPEDINGDFVIESSDFSVVENNSGSVMVARP